MLLKDLLPLPLLHQHIKDRIVTERSLDGSSLRILNYTARAQYENMWDAVTRRTRGLIYDFSTGAVVSRCFQKFFNYADPRQPETLPENLPTAQPFVSRKYDGSLGIGYQRDGQWCVATRGSFHSEQARWATAWIQRQNHISFPDGWTPHYEILYAANRIVVDYDFEGLVLLGLVNNETGTEIAPNGLKFIADACGLRVAETFDRPVAALLEENRANEEGYVLAWHTCDGAPLRVKVKFEEYCRRHRLVHQTSAVTVWEMLRNEQDVVETAAAAPSPMLDRINNTRETILFDWHTVYHEAYRLMGRAPKNVERKEFAAYATQHGEFAPLLFSLLDGKNIGDAVWKMVKPASRQPFLQEEA